MTRPTAAQVGAALETHEQVCAERYGGIITRLGKIEGMIVKAAAALILGMAGILAKLVFFT